jgi:hypothetical protein
VTGARDWREMRDRSARLLTERTGAGVAAWNRRVRDTGIDSEPALRWWLAANGVRGTRRCCS